MHFICNAVSRLIAFSFFTIGYGWIILPACFTHLILTFIWHLKQNYSLMDSMRLSFIHLFAYLYPLANESDKLKHPRISPAWYQTVSYRHCLDFKNELRFFLKIY